MCKIKLIVITTCLILQNVVAPPVTQNKKEETNEEADVNGLEDYMEYHRYLKEVVNALESDPEFRQKLEKADENDIKSGKIAEELEFVSHHVRTRLDEIKRVELERLKELTEKRRRLENVENSIDDDPTHHHLDHANPHTFEIEDLKKLIAKTTADLAEADRKRKEEFKQYEMEKEYKKIEKLNHTNGTEREKLEKEYKEMEEKHKKHEKLHEPGHKKQLEEVWEEQDQMQQDFDPKTFFMLHDVDGNGLWDQDEVKSLFIKELNKMYEAGAPEDDMRERMEEMERMRESVFNEMDVNRDGFIDFNEFMHRTQTQEFNQDHGWQGLDEQKPYTDEELAQFIAQQEAMRMNRQQAYPTYQQPYQGQQAYQQPHPNAVPQGYQQAPHNQVYQNQPNAGYHQQIPQGQQQVYQNQQNAVPQGYQQVPQNQGQQINQNVSPQQAYQQAPPQGQYQQNNPGLNQNNYEQQQVNANQQRQQQVNANQQQVNPNQQQQQVNMNQQQQQVNANQQQQQVNLNQQQQQQVNPNQQQQVNNNQQQQQINPNQQQQQQVNAVPQQQQNSLNQ